ncbi:MAG TPA: protease pro-enzyme activation domain-containing protein, partial [Candidatus Acidoferrales bacterium]|nr:protease pro-enzyme activation domain-containing protein [Candidatus Acidoferrales bacterium]
METIDERKLTTLKGNTRHEANVDNDRGVVADHFLLEHMLLQLQRPPELEKALVQFIDELHDPNSPNFHKWLTPEQFGERFGLAQQDMDTITLWLQSHGLIVNLVYPSGMVIDFSGTAGQVRAAFHTEIHNLEVKGEKHIGNMGEPQIPAALAPAVLGVVSLHDFRPRAMHKMSRVSPEYTFAGPTYAVVPADLATIYNLNPLFSAGYSGQGQTIVVVENTNVFSTSDWNTFRSAFGLSGYTSGSFTTVHPAPPSGTNNCSNPGVVPPIDAEAILDAEWASAAAPSAAIEMASCADTTTTFGGLIAIQNLINASTQPPAIMSISYGQCETVNGAAANAAYNAAYQQAVTEGVSIFVASGDSGAAACDNSVAQATHGIGANAFASTPYNVAVGGTDFSDTYARTNSIYWNSTNTSTFGSAISYIPEIPWNDSCAGVLLANHLGYTTTHGPSSLCNDPFFGLALSTTVSGGGGPSGCATGTPSTSGVVSGTCQGWPKPSWQSVLGNPGDGVRDTPDVSLFGADGLWNHYYVFCWSNTAHGGKGCTGAPSGWSGAGGTSFSSPIMAGIQALVNQRTGARQGNPNPVYYQLAAAEYGSSGSSSCNSSLGNGVASSCIFYDVTLGDMDVDCKGSFNCFLDSSPEGVLSTSNNSYNPAYGTATGWDFATGIGTVNAANLVNNWPAAPPRFILSASPSSLTITQGANGTTTITITPENVFSGNVSLSASGLPSGV